MREARTGSTARDLPFPSVPALRRADVSRASAGSPITSRSGRGRRAPKDGLSLAPEPSSPTPGSKEVDVFDHRADSPEIMNTPTPAGL